MSARLNCRAALACGAAFVKGIEGRRRRINCPKWVGLFRWLGPVLTTEWGEGVLKKGLADRMTLMEAEVAALGRSMSSRTNELEER